ncbi:MAG: hypothetical protein NUV31_04740 [Dehalococcoidales bacterium]|nr:hypothetical protein [Dehalococcoidales bacterium]
MELGPSLSMMGSPQLVSGSKVVASFRTPPYCGFPAVVFEVAAEFGVEAGVVFGEAEAHPVKIRKIMIMSVREMNNSFLCIDISLLSETLIPDI